MKIYDCFQFFNELDLLEIRLNVLNEHIDYFVLTESTSTFSGLDKPLYYQENKDRFKKFNYKIIYNVVDIPSNIEDCWEREIFQRNSLISKIRENILDEDLIITSDIDEIPNPEILKNLNDFFDENSLYHCQQKHFMYYLNNFVKDNWYGTRMCSYKFIKNKTVDLIRESTENKHQLTGYTIQNGGWHFSYLGGENIIKQKIESFSHQEFNNDQIKSQISKNLRNNTDIFYRPYNFKVFEIDENFPEYIRDNQDKYHYIIK